MPPRVTRAVTAAACVLLVLNLSVWAAGAPPGAVLRLVLAGTLGSGYGVGQLLAKATPLLFTGAAVALALRAGLFNIGAEGQGGLGILCAAVCGAWLPAGTPWLLALPLALLAAALGGGSLGALAGWLRGRFGTHEVLSTLMLNGLVAVLTTWLYGGPLRVGEQVHTRVIAPGARLPLAASFAPALRGSGLNLAFALGIVCVALAGLYLRSTRGGLALRALGASPGAAEALGVDPVRTATRAMALSGALAGLVGAHYVLGVKGFAEQGMGAGVGFTGIAVALLGALRPGGIVLAALFFGLLAQGGLVVNALVPADVLAVAQAAVIIAVAALGAGLRRGESTP
ncbi:MAG: ABC transporter permease [Deltaproteobacteria bacterium]|nr:ABC transporter permease [Deltaproteobacteria bacterium]